MGCANIKETQMITLICFYEIDNKEQKNYCLKLKENYKGSKPIKYEIKQIPQVSFGIKLRIKGNIYDIQKVFDDREETMIESLNKIYELIDNNSDNNINIKEKKETKEDKENKGGEEDKENNNNK